MKKSSFLQRLVGILALLIFVWGMQTIIVGKPVDELAKEQALSKELKASESKKGNKDKKEKPTLPDVSVNDWELLLVNKDYPAIDQSPELAVVGNVYVDARIADAATEFLLAAQEIDMREHFVAGYQSISYQTELYNYYVEQEMLANPNFTLEEAEQKVQTYLQPPSFSDHHTGLAVDMSTVDMMNSSDPATVSKIIAMAPQYGFVLRYPKGKEDVTGYSYEDWHFRYVGIESAKYMKKHKLTLEEYLQQLKEADK
ncbi:M15 family metallopeptidase [Streptococcus fryi]